MGEQIKRWAVGIQDGELILGRGDGYLPAKATPVCLASDMEKLEAELAELKEGLVGLVKDIVASTDEMQSRLSTAVLLLVVKKIEPDDQGAEEVTDA